MHQFSTCTRTVCGPEIPNNKNIREEGNKSNILSIKNHPHKAQLNVDQRLGPMRLLSTELSNVCQSACPSVKLRNIFP